jgi:hypothetical protein
LFVCFYNYYRRRRPPRRCSAPLSPASRPPLTRHSTSPTSQDFPAFSRPGPRGAPELDLDEFHDAREVVAALSEEYAAAESADYVGGGGAGGGAEALAAQLAAAGGLGDPRAPVHA